MATSWYGPALRECLNGGIDLDTNTTKLALVTSSYVFNKDDEFVDAGGANDVLDHEANVTNYTRGWGGAGRKTATVTISYDAASDRVEVVLADVTWTSLGGATNQTLVAAILVKEGGANDTTSRLIAYFDFADFTTNGTNFTLDFDNTDGNLFINV